MAYFFEWQRENPSQHRVRFPIVGSFTRLSLAPENCFDDGYLHLFEHMLLRANSEQLAAAERQGCTYNACTSANEVSFYFRSPDVNVPVDFAQFLEAPFTAADLDIEQATIAQEIQLRDSYQPALPKILGTPEVAAGFTLERLNQLRGHLTATPQLITYTAGVAPYIPIPRLDPDEFLDNLHTSWVDGALTWNDDPWGGLFQFFLWIAERTAPYPLDWHIDHDHRRLIPGTEAATFIQSNKTNLEFRYRLALTNLKRLDEEFFTYLRSVGLYIDTSQAFQEIPWETRLAHA